MKSPLARTRRRELAMSRRDEAHDDVERGKERSIYDVALSTTGVDGRKRAVNIAKRQA